MHANKPIQIIEIGSTFLSPFLLSVPLFAAYQNTTPLEFKIPILIASLLVGYLISDFFSGVGHWLADRYGSIQTPFLGSIILFFRIHHIYPKQMLQNNFFETIGTSCFAINLFLLAFLVCPKPVSSPGFLFFAGTLFFACFLLAATNFFHKLAHFDKPNKIIRFLQKCHIILSPSHHSVHHTAPFAANYCITCGWLNPILTKVRFFERVERLIFFLTGIRGGDYDLDTLKHAATQMLEEYKNAQPK